MSVREEFDEWAAAGRDRGMEERHWHTARHVLARMPVEAGDRVLDLGTGSGYALRALADTRDIGHGVGLDGAPKMAHNAREYAAEADTGESTLSFVVGEFGSLPLADDSVDHVFSMEAFYYSADPHETLREIRRVLRSGGTFHCAVNYYEENVHSHDWQEHIDVAMTRWSGPEYRAAFREAGLHVASQDNVPDRETEIPPAEAFPTENWETRAAMVERYREYGTLVTVGVAP
ncbi:class I SAM-dependent methyltransferase [Halobaculum sp. MBLA0147]|uniref:class I SAM-dependent methyltransferase n=1 Tax=Halobaculum sp. MBLA0147 TaxID=3079934 RepID=UPI0035244143